MSLKAVFAALALVALVGCEDGAIDFGGFAASQEGPTRGIRTMALLGGDVRVRGPGGYCIDREASNSRRGFAVMVGCAVVTDDFTVLPTLDGLITVQFGAAQTASVNGNEEAFADFLESDEGRSLLAGAGDIRNISQVTTVTDRAGVMARYLDQSAPSFAGTSGPQWRGFLDVRGRLVTLSVLSFDRGELSRAEGQRLMVIAMAQIAEVNADATITE